MPENQTAWNSDNEGNKETFNQTDRKETSSLAGEGDPQQDGKVADHAGRAG